MKDKIFHAICFGFLSGMLLRSFVFIEAYYVILFSLIAGAVLLFLIFTSKNNLGITLVVFFIFACLGVARYGVADIPNPELFESNVGAKVSITGEIIDEPSIREKNQQLILETQVEGSKIGILAYINLGEDVKYGDEIKIIGVLKKPENFITDQGKEFDYINYLRKDGILYIMSYPKIKVLSSGNGNFVKKILFSVKEKFLEKTNNVINSPESLLLGGLILGEKSSFPPELRQSFVDTGTIHIIALSGYNVTIVAEWFMKILSFLPLSFAIGSGIFAIILFILMTGGSSTAVRAGIMGVLALIARATGRNYDVARALILAGVSMVLINPLLLRYDVSFQLSFVATIAVIFFAPRIEKHFTWITKSFGLRDIVSVTTAAYIFVFPFILYKMGNLSLVALPANVFILPFIPMTMLFGFLTGFLGIILPILSIPIGFIAYLLLHYELSVIKVFANLPFASFAFPYFPPSITLAIYAYFIYKLFGESIRKFFNFSPELEENSAQ